MKIVLSAQCRVINDYTEKHHIIPKSLGGSNKKSNLVNLTAREHYICHKLLTKFTKNKNKKKMLLAVWAFNRSSKNQKRIVLKSRDYEFYRKEISKTLSETRKGKMNKGKILTQDHKEKISKSLKGKLKSAKTKEKMKQSWNYRPPRSDKHCKSLSIAGLGRIHSEETRKKMSESKKGKNPTHTQIEWTCEHCNKKGVGISNYNRWHGNNCRKIKNGS